MYIFVTLTVPNVSLPLYEGADGNVFWIGLVGEKRSVSLFTRERIEICAFLRLFLDTSVSLFTREWIEIPSV